MTHFRSVVMSTPAAFAAAMAAAGATKPRKTGAGGGAFHSWSWNNLQRESGTLHLCKSDDWISHIRHGAEEGSRRAVRSLRQLGKESPYAHAMDPSDSCRPAIHYAAANGDLKLVRALAEHGKADLDARVESVDPLGKAIAEGAPAFALRTASGVGPRYAACLQYLRQRTNVGEFERKKLAEAGKRSAALGRRPRRRRRQQQQQQRIPLPPIEASASGSAAPPPQQQRLTQDEQAGGRGELSSLCGKSKWDQYYRNTARASAHGAREAKRAEFVDQLAARTRGADEEHTRRIHMQTLGFIPGQAVSPYKMNNVSLPAELDNYPFRNGA